MSISKSFGHKGWEKNLELIHDLTLKEEFFSDPRIRLFVVPVPEFLRPKQSPFHYPKYSRDWGVEQDIDFAIRRLPARVFNPDEATHHFLPIFWTRYWVQNKYGKEGMDQMRAELDRLKLDEEKLFTVCQYDDGPSVDLFFGKGLFLASRQTELGEDIPLLATPLPKMIQTRKPKRILLSFSGRTSTHEIRTKMMEELGNLPSVKISNQNISTRAYYQALISSYIALAPRGYGGSSFRFFEAMQVATVPALIGNLDTRPFKEYIDWNEISFYSESPEDLYAQVAKYSNRDLIEMGEKAQKVYWEQLKFGRWTRLIWHQLLDAEVE